MKYEITQELLNAALQVIVTSKSTGYNYLEIDGLLKKLQALPKIAEPAKEKDAVCQPPEKEEVKK